MLVKQSELNNMEETQKFKPKLMVATRHLISVIVMLFIFGLLDFENFGKMFSLIVVILIISIFTIFLKERVTQINIDPQNRKVYLIVNRLFRNYTVIINIEDISFSFKNEIGPRGIKNRIFRVFKKNLTIVMIDPGIYGWSEDSLQDILDTIRIIKPDIKIEY
jgi:hypothetical protein